MQSIRTLGVVGAGTMGHGIAQVAAQSGYDVILVDVVPEAVERGLGHIGKSLEKLVGKGKLSAEDREAALGRIATGSRLDVLERADLVVEAVVEKLEVKQSVLGELDRLCPPHAILASNTSSISITRLAAVTRRPERVIGMHFMNPVPLKPMVEVIRGHHTSEETIATARGFLAKMEKDCIVVNDMPGFVSNRVLMLTINEAVYVLQDGVATAEQVDQLFKTCFGHKMGPLETADLIGLDTILYSIEALHESYNDSKYRPCPLLKKMVDAGLHGRKNGKGFYDYGISL